MLFWRTRFRAGIFLRLLFLRCVYDFDVDRLPLTVLEGVRSAAPAESWHPRCSRLVGVRVGEMGPRRVSTGRLRVWRLPHLDHGRPSSAADGAGESINTEISLPLDEGIADDLDRYVEITAAE